MTAPLFGSCQQLTTRLFITWYMPPVHNCSVTELMARLFITWYMLDVYKVNHYLVLVTTPSQNCLWFGLYTMSIITSALFGACHNSQPKCFVIWYTLAVYYNCSIIWSPTHSQNCFIAWDMPAVYNCTIFWCMPQHTAKIVYYLVYACWLFIITPPLFGTRHQLIVRDW